MYFSAYLIEYSSRGGVVWKASSAEHGRWQMWAARHVSQLVLNARIHSSVVWCIRSPRCQGISACWDGRGSWWWSVWSGRLSVSRRFIIDHPLWNSCWSSLQMLDGRLGINKLLQIWRQSKVSTSGSVWHYQCVFVCSLVCVATSPTLWKLLDRCPVVSWKRSNRSEWFMTAHSNPPPSHTQRWGGENLTLLYPPLSPFPVSLLHLFYYCQSNVW